MNALADNLWQSIPYLLIVVGSSYALAGALLVTDRIRTGRWFE